MLRNNRRGQRRPFFQGNNRTKQRRLADAMHRHPAVRSADNATANFTYQACEPRAMLASFVPGELLIQFEPTTGIDQRMIARAAVEADLVETIHTAAMRASGSGVLELVRLPENTDLETAMKSISQLPGVQFAEPNWIYQSTAVSNDTYYTNGSLWGMYSSDSPSAIGPSGTTNQFGVQAERAWNAGWTGSSNVVVGIIDEGFQVNHADLAANAWVNPYDPVDGIDNDGNGYVDDINGWDFVSNNNTVYDGTSDDHGTHVAGTIGGVGGNGLGVAGVNWDVTMVSLKFLGSSGGTTADAIEAIDYLTDLKTRHGMNIVASNNSWGGGGFSSSLLAAITRSAQADILFVAAAGNSGTNNNSSAFYPANYDTTASAGYDAVISVASITSSGARSSFSNYGLTTVDLGAPGSSIVSTVPSNSYSSYSGTSMATPHVTGAIALYRSTNANATAQSTKNTLFQNLTPTSSLSGLTVTGGRLDVWKLMTSGPTTPDLSIADVSITEGNSGTSLATFTVSLSAPATTAVSVNFATANQSALAGSDYVANSGVLNFAIGETSKTISVQIQGDTLFESNEQFLVNLSNASGANLADAQAVGTILNDDVATPPDISIADKLLNEGNVNSKTFTFRVSLSAASTTAVRFDYTTVDGTATAGSDYQAISGRITFSPGQTAKNVRVTVFGDTTPESNELFYVNIFNVTNAVVVKSQAIGTIRNDDGSGSPVAPRMGEFPAVGENSDEYSDIAIASTYWTNATHPLVEQASGSIGTRAPSPPLSPSRGVDTIQVPKSKTDANRQRLDSFVLSQRSSTAVVRSTELADFDLFEASRLDGVFSQLVDDNSF